MSKITRIAYNSAEWQRPTGEAKDSEGGNTYNRLHGFGHEDWLFRSEWLIDGWRYAFIQGINKSHAKLVKSGQPVDLTLFTMQPDKKRRYVATIRAVECLSDQQSDDALKEFKRRGWFDIMEREITAVGGNPTALGAARWAKHIINVRFRQENVFPFAPATFAAADDPVQKLMRYMLYDEEKIGRSAKTSTVRGRQGSRELPTIPSFHRRAVAPLDCTPEHNRMQARLMQELRVEYPTGQVVREQDFVDVIVRTETELLLFEIKSDLEPRTVIRQALGQILEYGYHPSRQHSVPIRLIIVGRRHPLADDTAYLKRLQKNFGLPLEYRVVSI